MKPQKGAGLALCLAGLVAVTACCSTPLSWSVAESDRVEAVEVSRCNADLEISVSSSRGIGSLTLEFGEPVLVDSIRITLMYDSLTPYHYCESLGFAQSHGEGSGLWMEDYGMTDLRPSGTLIIPSGDEFTLLKLGWVDFYRQ